MNKADVVVILLFVIIGVYCFNESTNIGIEAEEEFENSNFPDAMDSGFASGVYMGLVGSSVSIIVYILLNSLFR